VREFKLPSKFFQKVLLLVSIPLAFQLVFLFALSQMLDQAEREVKRAACARSLHTHVRTLVKSLTSGAAIGYTTISGKLFLERFQTAIASIPDELVELDRFGGLNAEQVRRYQQFSKSIGELKAKCTRGSSLLQQGKTEEGSAILDSMTASMADVWQESELILKDVKQIEENTPAVQTETRKAVSALLWFGAAVNICLVIGLAVAFHRNTAARLNTLMENTALFAKKKPLLPVVAGGDEIASLDTCFHKMADDLGELDRMKQEFLSMLSHDLRSPLTSLKITMEMLSEGHLGELTKEGKDIISRAGSSTGRMLNMINMMLDLDKLEAGKFNLDLKRVSIAHIVEQASDSLKAWAMQQRVKIELPKTDADILGDAERLIEVMTNLISNAIKYAPPLTKITITVDSHETSVEVGVNDQGPGIPPEQQMAIFDPFYQVKDGPRFKTVGTGLGLAICKKMIEAHDGMIGIRSEKGKGSTFWVRLPLYQGQKAVENKDALATSEAAPE
jgi:signal transduction histidine kinase